MPGPTDARGYSPGSPFYNNPAGSLGGAPAFGYTGAYGGVPSVPNPITTAGAAGGGNLGNLPGFQGLAGAVNPYNTQQQIAQLEQMIPGYTGNEAKSSQNIFQELSGQVPSDVTNQIIQSAAERGVLTGGGPNTNAAYLRALGLTSLGMQQQGQQNLTQQIGRTPRPPLFNPASMFVSPEQFQEAQFGANVFAGAPVPSQAAEEARRNARAGMSFGAGSVPRAPGFSYPTSYPGQSNFGTPTFGGGGYDTGFAPGSAGAYNNWNQWMGGVRGGAGGMGGMDEYNWIADQGFDPATYGVNQGGSYFAGANPGLPQDEPPAPMLLE